LGVAIVIGATLGSGWAMASLGTRYSPVLRIAKEHVLVERGPYRWIRHPLYSFELPFAIGCGLAARNWFIIASGVVVVGLAMFVRTPREEAMLLEGFGEPYRD